MVKKGEKGKGLVRVNITVADRVNPPYLIVAKRPKQNMYEEFRWRHDKLKFFYGVVYWPNPNNEQGFILNR